MSEILQSNRNPDNCMISSRPCRVMQGESEEDMKQKADLTTVHNMNEPDVEKCPYCGHDEYYVKIRYSGEGIYRYRFDGNAAGNEDMYDCLRDRPISKFAYCCNCDKRIFRIKE